MHHAPPCSSIESAKCGVHSNMFVSPLGEVRVVGRGYEDVWQREAVMLIAGESDVARSGSTKGRYVRAVTLR
jgi:hypothetical protein